jgi:hypothetical protein
MGGWWDDGEIGEEHIRSSFIKILASARTEKIAARLHHQRLPCSSARCMHGRERRKILPLRPPPDLAQLLLPTFPLPISSTWANLLKELVQGNAVPGATMFNTAPNCGVSFLLAKPVDLSMGPAAI